MATFIKKAIRHPGAERAAAKRNGRSTLEEARVESRSSDPRIARRGRLAKRLISGDLSHR